MMQPTPRPLYRIISALLIVWQSGGCHERVDMSVAMRPLVVEAAVFGNVGPTQPIIVIKSGTSSNDGWSMALLRGRDELQWYLKEQLWQGTSPWAPASVRVLENIQVTAVLDSAEQWINDVQSEPSTPIIVAYPHDGVLEPDLLLVLAKFGDRVLAKPYDPAALEP